MALFDRLVEVADEAPDNSLTFVNFVDFDMLFGHRRDLAGYCTRCTSWTRACPSSWRR